MKQNGWITKYVSDKYNIREYSCEIIKIIYFQLNLFISLLAQLLKFLYGGEVGL